MNAVVPLVFPDDCRVCGEPLKTVTRIPVCHACLHAPEPLLADFFCSSCGTPFVNRYPLDEEGRCMLCRLGLKGFDAVYSFGSYEGTLRELVHLYKYDGMRPLAEPFGALIARTIPRDRRFDAVVPMPLHWRKQWQRGFNQADLLAAEVARRWGVPLRRVVGKRATAPQAGLTNAKRRANVRGAFRAKQRLDGLDVLLVDDVLTTGATASACALALKRAGARHVTLATVARTDRRMGVDPASIGTGSAIAGSRGAHA